MTTPRTPTYDPDCYSLAVSFLQDEPDINSAEHRDALAVAIQQAIEDELDFMRACQEGRIVPW